MKRFPISAVIITLNEENNIEACLKPLLEIAEEVLVFDSGSTDQTCAIAEQLGAKVLSTTWQGYAQTKNLANQAARFDWILSIDADEVVSPELQQSIIQLELKKGCVYELDRFTNYCGRWVKHSGWYPDWKVRLFNRTEVEWIGDFVHETLQIPTDSKVIRLEGKLLHYSYRSSEDHWQRIEKYARLSAEKLFHKGKKATWFKSTFSPISRFIRTYFLKKGILDGQIGWRLSIRNAYMVRKKYRILKELHQKSKQDAGNKS